MKMEEKETTFIPGYLPRWENKVVKKPLKERTKRSSVANF